MKKNNKGRYPDNVLREIESLLSEHYDENNKIDSFNIDALDNALEIFISLYKDQAVATRRVEEFRMFYDEHVRISDIARHYNKTITVISADIEMVLRRLAFNNHMSAALKCMEASEVTRDTSILHTDLSTRVKNALHRAYRWKLKRTPNIGDILDIEYWDLMKTRNLGHRGIDELYGFMKKHGFELKPCSMNGETCDGHRCLLNEYVRNCKMLKENKDE